MAIIFTSDKMNKTSKYLENGVWVTEIDIVNLEDIYSVLAVDAKSSPLKIKVDDDPWYEHLSYADYLNNIEFI